MRFGGYSNSGSQGQLLGVYLFGGPPQVKASHVRFPDRLAGL